MLEHKSATLPDTCYSCSHIPVACSSPPGTPRHCSGLPGGTVWWQCGQRGPPETNLNSARRRRYQYQWPAPRRKGLLPTPTKRQKRQCINLRTIKNRHVVTALHKHYHSHTVTYGVSVCPCEYCALWDHTVLLHMDPSCPPCEPCGELSTDVRESWTEMATSSQVGDCETAIKGQGAHEWSNWPASRPVSPTADSPCTQGQHPAPASGSERHTVS